MTTWIQSDYTRATGGCQRTSRAASCLDSERLLLNTRDALRWSMTTWIQSDYTRATGGCQRMSSAASCLDSERLLLNTRACPENEGVEEEHSRLDSE